MTYDSQPHVNLKRQRVCHVCGSLCDKYEDVTRPLLAVAFALPAVSAPFVLIICYPRPPLPHCEPLLIRQS